MFEIHKNRKYFWTIVKFNEQMVTENFNLNKDQKNIK